MIDISKSLYNCLSGFNGAKGSTSAEKHASLNASFELLAKKIIYGGFIKVRNEYAIFISNVEFYYHEEKGVAGERVLDKIVYHRNGKFVDREVPYFPMMTLHSHWSGFDIAFEKKSGHYRASALIRKYVVLDLKTGKFLNLDTSNRTDDVGNIEEKIIGEITQHLEPVVDDRSTYLQYYLNGFAFGGASSVIKWQDANLGDYYEVINVDRRNADAHKWGYIYADKQKYSATIMKSKEKLLKYRKAIIPFPGAGLSSFWRR